MSDTPEDEFAKKFEEARQVILKLLDMQSSAETDDQPKRALDDVRNLVTPLRWPHDEFLRRAGFFDWDFGSERWLKRQRLVEDINEMIMDYQEKTGRDFMEDMMAVISKEDADDEKS